MRNRSPGSPGSEIDLDFFKEVENEAQINEKGKDDPFKGIKIKENTPFEYAEDIIENENLDDK